MKKSSTKFVSVEWPKLLSGEPLVIKDANNPKTRLSFTIRRSFLGQEQTEASERQYYWMMCAPNGNVLGYFICANTEYLRKSDIQSMMTGLSRDGKEDFYLVKKRRSFKIEMPPIDDEDTDNNES